MLSNAKVIPTIPAADIDRAKKFYGEALGLEVQTEMGDDGVIYKCGGGTSLLVYKSAGAGTSGATYAGFSVEDIEETMSGLRSKGVKFEEYDMPGIKTVNGVASYEGGKSAWFKDTEGNILALDQRVK